MKKKRRETRCGTIRYWVDHAGEGPCLVFLPGLTADHRLFTQQVAYFLGKRPLLVWDPPGHGASWPFDLSFDLFDKAQWLDEILRHEGFDAPVIIGQSMGGYVGQAYAQRYPGKLRGFVSIDSAPLQRQYVTALEIWLLKRMEPVYRHFPWRWLLRSGTEGVSTTRRGRALMRQMMMEYDGDQARYARLSGHGFRMLADAMEADLPYALGCPALLLCGEEDHAGSCIYYNKRWHARTGIPLVWIAGAGHNANTDRPAQVDALLERFVRERVERRQDAPGKQNG